MRGSFFWMVLFEFLAVLFVVARILFSYCADSLPIAISTPAFKPVQSCRRFYKGDYFFCLFADFALFKAIFCNVFQIGNRPAAAPLHDFCFGFHAD